MPEELQQQIISLKKDLDTFKLHDHVFNGFPVAIKNFQNFGYHELSIIIADTAAQTAANYGRFFTADFDIEIISAQEVHGTATTNADTLDVRKVTSGQAPSSGVTCIASTWTINSTANTPVRKTSTITKANRILKQGDGLALVTSGTLAGIKHIVVTVYYLPL